MGYNIYMELEELIRFCAFVGAWLLFLGPMHQASIELREEDEARDRLHRAHKQMPDPAHASSWWWLFPPVKIILESRVRGQYRREVWSKLSTDDKIILSNYVRKARAWLYVGLGGLLIAIKESFELFEVMHWSFDLLLPTVIVAALLCLGSVVRTSKAEERHAD